MSDTSQGPGWWQASDGKWYPPEQAPTAAQPISEPTATQPAAGPPVYADPAAPAAAAAGGGGGAKVIAIVVALVLIAGGAAFALTRSSGGGGSVKAFCDKAKSLQQDTSLDKAFNDPAKIDSALAKFDDLAKTAPSEIKNDMNTLVDAVKKIAGAVKAAGNDPSKQFGAVFGAIAQLDQKKLEQATKNIETFGKTKCGADFSLSDSSSSSSSDSSLSSLNPSDSSFSFDDSSFSSFLSSFSSDFGSDFFSTSS
ncbi:MAG: hypothetical protein QOC92_1167 [Acidimicrobiaceae bacterium]